MFRPVWALSVRTRTFLRRYMPTNILLDAIRTRRGLKWGTPAMLLAIPYLFAAAVCASLIRDGGPGWLNLLVLLFIWNALKFLIMGPVSLILLIGVRSKEAATKRRNPLNAVFEEHSCLEAALPVRAKAPSNNDDATSAAPEAEGRSRRE